MAKYLVASMRGALVAAAACGLIAGAANAETSIQVQTGTGDFISWSDHIAVEDPTLLSFRWSTTEAAAVGGDWVVEGPFPAPVIVVGPGVSILPHGKVLPAGPGGHSGVFNLPANTFLLKAPPADPGVKFTLRFKATNASGQQVGPWAKSVTINQSKAAAGVTFGFLNGKPEGDASPLPSVAPFEVTTGALDAQVTAGKTALLVGDAGRLAVYAKTGAKLADLDLGDIFGDLWKADNAASPRPNNVNAGLAKSFTFAKAIIPCLIESPTDQRPPDPNPSDGHNRNLPTSSCISELYDMRFGFDTVRNRFWVIAAARNKIWRTSEKDPLNPDITRPTAVGEQARRKIFVAISNSGDPTAGFDKVYSVTGDYNDWPEFQVNGDYALFTHWNASTSTSVYDANKLVAGQKVQLGKTYTDADYGTSAYVPARHHGTGADRLFFVGAAGAESRQLALNAIYKTKLLTADHKVKLPFAAPMSDVVYRDGRINMVGGDGRGIRYLSFPLTIADGKLVIGKTGQLSDVAASNAHDQGVRNLLIVDPDAPMVSYDNPSLEVTGGGEVLVSFRAMGTKGGAIVPQQARYAVLYHDEAKFRRHVVMRTSGAASTRNDKNRIDYTQDALDPDDRTVWIAGVYAAPDSGGSTGPLKVVVGAVQP